MKNSRRCLARIERPSDVLKQPLQSLLRSCDRLLFRAVQRLAKRALPPRVPHNPAQILLVRRNRLGDAICVLPLIESLKRNYPEARIAVLASQHNAQVFRLAHFIECVYEAPERYWGNRWLLFAHPVMRSIRKRRFDVTIVASLTPSSHGARLALYSGARFCVGPISSEGSLYDLVFQGGVPVDALTKVHQVERLGEVVERAGMRVGPCLPSVELSCVGSRPLKSPRITLCPDVNRAASAWPLERYRRLVMLLRCCHPEWPISMLVQRDTGRYSSLQSCGVELIETPAFSEFVNEISRATVVVCSEGGTSHLAPALGVPTIALSGVSIALSWAPWNPLAQVIERTGAVADITAEEVLQRVEALHASLAEQSDCATAAMR